jgi:hypothetical protein
MKPEGKKPFRDQGENGRIILLKCVLSYVQEIVCVRMSAGFSWLSILF